MAILTAFWSGRHTTVHTYNSTGPRRAVVVEFIVDPGPDLSAGGEEVGVGYVNFNAPNTSD